MAQKYLDEMKQQIGQILNIHEEGELESDGNLEDEKENLPQSGGEVENVPTLSGSTVDESYFDSATA